MTIVLGHCHRKKKEYVVEPSCPQPEKGQLEDSAYMHLHQTHDIPCDHHHMDISVTSCVCSTITMIIYVGHLQYYAHV